jgi:hypothetical protein
MKGRIKGAGFVVGGLALLSILNRTLMDTYGSLSGFLVFFIGLVLCFWGGTLLRGDEI